MDEDGSDGFPAFGFRYGSDVKVPYRIIMPEKLFPEFSILIRAKPKSVNGGYIFAVVNSYETVVQLGVRLVRTGLNMNISLIYTDPSQLASVSIANFTVNNFVNIWTRFAIRVQSDNITLFYNCKENATVPFKRHPEQLVFDSASTLYIAKAGSKTPEYYEVIIFFEYIILTG